MPKIISKEPKNHGWIIKTDDGETWSLVNLGSLMKIMPNHARLKELGLYMGWEAYSGGDECYRDTEENLIKRIESGNLKK